MVSEIVVKFSLSWECDIWLSVGLFPFVGFDGFSIQLPTKKPQVSRPGAFSFTSGAPASFELDSKVPVFIGSA